jgi:hypothetical protein
MLYYHFYINLYVDFIVHPAGVLDLTSAFAPLNTKLIVTGIVDGPTSNVEVSVNWNEPFNQCPIKFPAR